MHRLLAALLLTAACGDAEPGTLGPQNYDGGAGGQGGGSVASSSSSAGGEGGAATASSASSTAGAGGDATGGSGGQGGAPVMDPPGFECHGINWGWHYQCGTGAVSGSMSYHITHSDGVSTYFCYPELPSSWLPDCPSGTPCTVKLNNGTEKDGTCD